MYSKGFVNLLEVHRLLVKLCIIVAGIEILAADTTVQITTSHSEDCFHWLITFTSQHTTDFVSVLFNHFKLHHPDQESYLGPQAPWWSSMVTLMNATTLYIKAALKEGMRDECYIANFT